MSVERLTYWCNDGMGSGEWRVNVKKYEDSGTHVDRLAAIEDILGDDYDLSRLRDLVQIDREGRCVVLPFKVGDTAWFTAYGGRPVSSEVSSVAIAFRVDGAHYYFETENEDGSTDYFHGEAIGKTVFLTREAAEKALKEEKHA